MENKRIILGLDVSTACIGCCIMLLENGKKEILKLTHVSPKISSKIKGIEALCLKKNIFENEFLVKYKDYGITDVVIEEPLLGSNNINTIGILLRFNGMISDSVYRILGVVPEYISSYDARKYSFPQLLAIRQFDKKGNKYPYKVIKKAIKDTNLTLFGGYMWDIAKKDVMLGLLSDNYPEIEWVYNNKGELKKENFDASDSAICCLGYINMKENGTIEYKIVNVIETQTQIDYDVSIWNNTYKHVINL